MSKTLKNVMSREESLLSLLGINPFVKQLQDPQEAFEHFKKADEAESIIKAYKSSMREQLFNIAEKTVEPDEKGSYKVELPDGRWFKKEARTSVSLDENKVTELAEKKNLPVVKKVAKIANDVNIRSKVLEILERELPEAIAEVQEAIDDGLLEQLYIEGKITEEEFKDLVITSTSYALRKSKD